MAIATMYKRGLVTVITPFYNTAARFIEEAIGSVLGQTYPHWELLLIDDGSDGECRAVAQGYAMRLPDQVKYLRHPGGRNCGMSASRNLGIASASGEYLAFLDADDVWLPHTLWEQVSSLESQPMAAMVYGNTEYWHSWTGRAEDLQRDFRPKLGITPDTLVSPPALVPVLLEGSGAVPCTCSLLVRRQAVIESLGGFEQAFRTLYEDQVFYLKVCLRAPVYVAGRSWGRYRQHAGMSTGAALSEQGSVSARLRFLRWVEGYLLEHKIQDPHIWQTLRQQIWLCSPHDGSGRLISARRWVRRVKKWALKLQRRVLPRPVQAKLWRRRPLDA